MPCYANDICVVDVVVLLTFAVDLALLLCLGSGFQALPTFGTPEAVLVPRLQ